MRLSCLVLVLEALLAVPGNATAQQTSVWQFGAREVDWEAIARLQEEVRDYQEAGAIGDYEISIWPNGTRFDVMVVAEVEDPRKLADLRGLDTAETASEKTAAREVPAATALLRPGSIPPAVPE